MHVAAVEIGLAPDIWTAQEHKICDYGRNLDFGRLQEFAGGKREEAGRVVLGRAALTALRAPRESGSGYLASR